MEKEYLEFVDESMIEVMDDEYLNRKFAGFENIIYSLVENGAVVFPKSESIENHLLKFDWVKSDEELEECQGIVRYVIDRSSFMQNNQFKERVLSELKTRNRENKKAQQEINENTEFMNMLISQTGFKLNKK